MSEKETIEVLLVAPGREPERIQIGQDLASMQKVVGGYIEEVMPFDEEVAVICNEEGKLNSLKLNRALYNENGEMIDIIAGSFFVCSAPFTSENFESLSEKQFAKYEELFRAPEQFYRTATGISAIKMYIPETTQKERE